MFTIVRKVYVLKPLGRIPDDSGGQLMKSELCKIVVGGYKNILLDLRLSQP
jgi:hypothetical protein